ncbi:MAG: hypothetical protein ACXWV5_06325 [Flavitalea sp.]
MDNIKNRWKDAKNEIQPHSVTAADLAAEARKKRKSIVYFQYGNIAVLTATLMLISFFFFRVVAFETALSQSGIFLMIGALVIRILVEIYSLQNAKKILPEKSLTTTTHDALSYYHYRKKVHGPVTIVTVALYVIGYALLSPEFSIYIDFKWMVLMHVSFVLGAAFLIWQIRKGILEEMANLNRLVKLEEELGKA